jgi:hypothetical protein
VEIRTGIVKPGFSSDMDFRETVAVMTGTRPVTKTTTQFVAAVTHRAADEQFIIRVRPMDPVPGGFVSGGPEVALRALGAEIVAVGTF